MGDGRSGLRVSHTSFYRGLCPPPGYRLKNQSALNQQALRF